MVEFLKVGSKEIPTLSGLKYTYNNLDEGIRCVQLDDKKFTIFLGCDQVNKLNYLIITQTYQVLTLKLLIYQ